MNFEIYEEKKKYLLQSKSLILPPNTKPPPILSPNADLGKGKCVDGLGFADQRWAWVGGMDLRLGSTAWVGGMGQW